MRFVSLSANNPGIYTGRTGNNTYLLPGETPTLIDAGIGDARHIDAIAEALESFGGGSLSRVIVTHAHSDHASGAPAIAVRWPAARFFKFPSPERDSRYAVNWEPLAEGDRVTAGDEQLEVVYTPGHAPDHISLWHAPTRALFSGDLAVMGTTVVIPGGKGGSVSGYIRSLERVLALAPSVLLPAHGSAIYEVERVLRNYIAHRREREQQIVAALSDGARTPDEILAQLYPSVHPQLAESARASIVAHLEKLQEERRAGEAADGTWALVASDSIS